MHLQPDLAVSYYGIVTVTTEPRLETVEMRNGVGAPWPFLSDTERKLLNELELADVQISDDSTYVGKRLAETDWREQGVMIIGIRRANGELLMPPPADTIIHGGDSLFAFGSAASVNAMIGDAEAVD